MLVNVGPGVHVGVEGRREVVGVIALSGRWAGAGGLVRKKGEALQARGGMPVGAFEHGARLGGGGVGRRVGVLGRYLVVVALERSACDSGAGEGGINCLVCGGVMLGWLLWWWSCTWVAWGCEWGSVRHTWVRAGVRLWGTFGNLEAMAS